MLLNKSLVHIQLVVSQFLFRTLPIFCFLNFLVKNFLVELVGSVYVEDDYIRLVSLNDDIDFEGNRLFPDILLPRDENTQIIGKVIEAFTPIEKV
ncbi:hypothetical protein T211_11880 [Lactococcus lactis subsp. lactis bv. diacetylactis str. LD61]|nr:hypothetical protein T211_11880 [Lactococcus lactis subsp. lactis bv. diacetylactis str. LD61]MCT3103493.1 hypothetical protein [Lactococcus lactis]RQE15629.1 hypothetical protein D6115_00080 [Lactococcus lactis]